MLIPMRSMALFNDAGRGGIFGAAAMLPGDAGRATDAARPGDLQQRLRESPRAA
jgi:hypothetical protein